MKKVLLTAAIGCAFMTSAFAAQPPTTLNNAFQIGVIDYISMSPSGGPFPPDLLQKTFNTNNTFDMNTPFVMTTTPFQVTASRSWHVTFDGTDFARTTPYVGTGNVTNLIPIGSDVFQILSVGTTANVTGNNSYEDIQTSPTPVVTGKGGASNGFNLTSKIDLSSAMSEMNIEGSYNTTIHVIAALD